MQLGVDCDDTKHESMNRSMHTAWSLIKIHTVEPSQTYEKESALFLGGRRGDRVSQS
jgi:hypothetical protein